MAGSQDTLGVEDLSITDTDLCHAELSGCSDVNLSDISDELESVISPCSLESGFCSRESLDFDLSDAQLESSILDPDVHSSELFRHRKGLEKRRHPKDSMEHQTQITIPNRKKLVKWLSYLNYLFEYSQETIFLAVNILDRYLQTTQVSRKTFQLVGVAAFLVAAKHEEVELPEINALIYACGQIFGRYQIIEMEKHILVSLDFELFGSTASFFLEYFARCEMAAKKGTEDAGFKNAHRLARYYIELSLQDYKLCQYLPSMVALCAWKSAVRRCTCLPKYECCHCWEKQFDQVVYNSCHADFVLFTLLKCSLSEDYFVENTCEYEDRYR